MFAGGGFFHGGWEDFGLLGCLFGTVDGGVSISRLVYRRY